MTPELQIAIVGGIGVAINAMSLVIVAFIQSRASLRNHSAIQAVSENVDRVEKNTNSLSAKVADAAGIAGEIRGALAERKRQEVDVSKS
jgi:hypothetical protein